MVDGLDLGNGKNFQTGTIKSESGFPIINLLSGPSSVCQLVWVIWVSMVLVERPFFPPITPVVFLRLVVVLVLSVLVINHLRRMMALFQVDPQPDEINYQAYNRDREELELKVSRDQLENQAYLRLE